MSIKDLVKKYGVEDLFVVPIELQLIYIFEKTTWNGGSHRFVVRYNGKTLTFEDFTKDFDSHHGSQIERNLKRLGFSDANSEKVYVKLREMMPPSNPFCGTKDRYLPNSRKYRTFYCLDSIEISQASDIKLNGWICNKEHPLILAKKGERYVALHEATSDLILVCVNEEDRKKIDLDVQEALDRGIEMDSDGNLYDPNEDFDPDEDWEDD